MVTWRESPVDDPEARRLLTDYFASRAAGFPGGPSAYRTTVPVPDQFVPPLGVFLVAVVDGVSIGCGGIRRIEPGPDGLHRFEAKHLWVEPAGRGTGLGRGLLVELERRARQLGADELVLDTNASLEAAGGLYRSSGFVGIEPYNDNPNATNWYAKRLR